MNTLRRKLPSELWELDQGTVFLTFEDELVETAAPALEEERARLQLYQMLGSMKDAKYVIQHATDRWYRPN